MVNDDALPEPRADFDSFFRESYTGLYAFACYLGASQQEAHDVLAAAMSDVFRCWADIDNPGAYARKAVISNFLKGRERERRRLQRVERHVGRDDARDDAAEDRLARWEGEEWVMQQIRTLPPRQREAMALIVDGLSPTEAAKLLGRTPEAVRQNLLAARRQLESTLTAEGFYARPADRRQSARKEGM